MVYLPTYMVDFHGRCTAWLINIPTYQSHWIRAGLGSKLKPPKSTGGFGGVDHLIHTEMNPKCPIVVDVCFVET